MSQDEITSIYKAKHNNSRDSWEQTRLLAFYNLVSQTGNKVFKKPADVFPLEWDDKKDNKKVVTVSKEEALKRLHNNRINKKKVNGN
jgi:hypothetical protein